MSSRIRSVKLTDCYIQANDSSCYVGGLVNMNYGIIEFCTLENTEIYYSADNSFNLPSIYIGGIAGANDGGITSCSNDYLNVNLCGNNAQLRNVFIGGLAGNASQSVIETSVEKTLKVNFDVQSIEKCYIGGLVGSCGFESLHASSINECIAGPSDIILNYNSSHIQEQYIGGLCGKQSSGNISSNYCYMNLEGAYGENLYIGGLIGYYISGEYNASNEYTVEKDGQYMEVNPIGYIQSKYLFTTISTSGITFILNYLDYLIEGVTGYIYKVGITNDDGSIVPYGEFENIDKVRDLGSTSSSDYNNAVQYLKDYIDTNNSIPEGVNRSDGNRRFKFSRIKCSAFTLYYLHIVDIL